MKPGWLDFPSRLMIMRIRPCVQCLWGIIKSRTREHCLRKEPEALSLLGTPIPGLKWDTTGSLVWLPAVSQHTSYCKDGGEGASKNVKPGSLIQLDVICVSNQRSPASRESLQKPRLVTQILSNRACPAYQSLLLRSFRFHQKQKGGHWTCGL